MVVRLLYKTLAFLVLSVLHGPAHAQIPQQPRALSRLSERQDSASSLSNTTKTSEWSSFVGWAGLHPLGDNKFQRVVKGNQTGTALIVNFPGQKIPSTQTSRALFYDLRDSVLGEGILTTVQVGATDLFSDCPRPPCMTDQTCKPFYKCFFGALSGLGGYDDNTALRAANGRFTQCFAQQTNQTVQCPVTFLNLTAPAGENQAQRVLCKDPFYETTTANWNEANTDAEFQYFINGGASQDNIYWPGHDTSTPFVKDLANQMTRYDNVQCSIKYPCTQDLVCSEVGAQSSFEGGRTILRSRAAYFIMVSLENINRQLANQYQGIYNALTQIASETWNIDAFFPKTNDGTGIAKALGGLGTVLGLISGFVPIVGPGLSAVGTITSAVGDYVGDKLSTAAQADPNFASKSFQQKVSGLSDLILPALETAANTLFAGQQVSNNFSLATMMQGGTWVNQSGLPELTDLVGMLRKEIVSRSINAMWKTFSSNKMWVLFTDLHDDDNHTNCTAHKRGPPDSKYCADGGVYYTYNFHEYNNGGYVSYPWGGDQLYNTFKINLTSVTEASVKTYRWALKNNISNPFNVSDADNTNSFVQVLEQDPAARADLSILAGRYPGSWTLPVCDSGTWGEDWQWDYTKDNRNDETHPPCLCGPKGSETDMWQKAAGMEDFRTFWHECTQALEDKNFKWPDGVTSVSYSGRDPKSIPYKVKKPGT